MTTATAQPSAKGNKGAQAAPMLRPFFPGTLDLETHTYTETETMTTSQVSFDTYNVRTNGFLADLHLEMTATTAGNAATVAFEEDGPISAIGVFTLSDTGGQPILGPMTGWELATFVKWGGFSFSDDVKSSQTYSATTGAGATGGSFSFILHVPIQFVAREGGLGSLPNTNSNNAYMVDVTMAASTDVYTTSPTALPSVNLKIHQDSYRQSSGRDAQKNATVTTPPGLGSVLYLRRNTQTFSAGSVDEELSQYEGSYRVLTFVLRDSADSRTQGDSDWPSSTQVQLNNDVPYDRTKNMWIRKQERQYGYTAAVGAAGGRDYGTFSLPFNTDGGLKAGSEDRYRYLSVSAADTLSFRGTIGGSGTHKLTTMYDFVRPPGGNIRALTAR